MTQKQQVINSTDWQNPELTGKNREKAVSFFIPFAGTDRVEYEKFESSSRYLSLNGSWKFRFFDTASELPQNIGDKSYDTADFDEIPVPLSWQMAGYEKPQYLNANYPIPVNPPYVPNMNPAGVYKKTFTLPAGFQGQRLFLNLEGVNSFYYLFVEGEPVGFSKGAHSLSRFEVTDFIHGDTFEVTVVVLKWSDGTYLEDQDCYRYNGIYRDVYLTARPQSFIEDIEIHTRLENDYTDGVVEVTAKANGTVEDALMRLIAPDGTVLQACSAKAENGTLRAAFRVEKAATWTAETPVLYTLETEACGELIPIRFGIRTIETSKKGQLLVNGRPVKLYGVNRHDSSPDTGHYVSPEHMLNDLLQMKRHNINAIRTSHYPNSSLFLTLCDRLGFYVISEGDIESHGCGVDCMMDPQLIGDDPVWEKAFIDRVERMILRDRNHPSVIMWSMGNESFMGKNQKAAIDMMHRYAEKDGRLVHYEGACREVWDLFHNPRIFNCNGDIDYKNLTVRSRMYPAPDTIRELLSSSDERPFFLCEFCHAMGVGPGGLTEYMELIENNDNFIGGCIWEWCDHSARATDEKTGKEFYTYGGYFGDFPNDGNFCVDGLVYPDRRPHTGLLEYKQHIKPLYAKITGKDEITLYSRYDFIASDNLDMVCRILRDGRIFREERINRTGVPARGSKTFKIDLSVPDDGRDYRLLVSFLQNGDTLWEKAGYEVGFSEEPMLTSADQADYYRFETETAAVSPLSYRENGACLTVSGDGFAYTFHTVRGALTRIEKQGNVLLDHAAELCAFRAPLDNDRNIKNAWYRQHLNHLFTSADKVTLKEQSEARFVMEAQVILAAASIKPIVRGNVTYTVTGDGVITVEISTETRMDLEFSLPRFGMELILQKGFEPLSYFGKGPYENYPDFKAASHTGVFDSTVSDQYEPYIFPQSCGNHTDVRWLTLKHESGQTLTVVPKGQMHFTALHFTENDLERAQYTKDLNPREETVLHIDYKNGGIGSNSCGPITFKKYTIDRRWIDFSFRLF